MPTWPLWQKVSLLSSPVWMLVTQMSRLLMKLMKSGATGQILASMRVPEHWLLISTGCTGKVCKSARDNEERHFLLEEICCNTLETDGSRRKKYCWSENLKTRCLHVLLKITAPTFHCVYCTSQNTHYDTVWTLVEVGTQVYILCK